MVKSTSPSSFRNKYKDAQRDRTLIHPRIPQHPQQNNSEKNVSQDVPEQGGGTGSTVNATSQIPPAAHAPPSHSFVVCADTQFGMTSDNKEWETEIEYSRSAVEYINNLSPRPLFCCVCGDLVEMMPFGEDEKVSELTEQQVSDIQDRQRVDFQNVWSYLHPDIALVCVCGNHDVGNRPTKSSIESFTQKFGDDYFSFWATQSSYNIVLNSALFSNQTGDGAQELCDEQFQWLQDQLEHARGSSSNECNTIFVFGHHPWFLYDEDEESVTMTGASPYKSAMIPDSYFHIPRQSRRKVLELFKKYNVTASFAGHFHQNLISKTSFGMDMIITSSLSEVFQSTANKNPPSTEPSTRGIRLVEVDNAKKGAYEHRFISLP